MAHLPTSTNPRFLPHRRTILLMPAALGVAAATGAQGASVRTVTRDGAGELGYRETVHVRTAYDRMRF